MSLATLLFSLIILTSPTFAQDTSYNAVIQQLLKIDELDQRHRNQVEFTETKYGSESKELKLLYKKMALADSVNLIQVELILNKYGWLGIDKIGSQANSTLFMVIQHSSLSIQEKYLPLMREAVKNGNAKAKSLALLEDRIAIFKGKMQNYGSQLFWSKQRNKYSLFPLSNPETVDIRRAEVGLQPLAEYLSHWGIMWDVEQYKKDLPLILDEWEIILTHIEHLKL